MFKLLKAATFYFDHWRLYRIKLQKYNHGANAMNIGVVYLMI
jgi:hypothetical protein